MQFMQRSHFSGSSTGRYSRQLPVIIIGCSPTGAGVTHPSGTSFSFGILNIAWSPLNLNLVEVLHYSLFVAFAKGVGVLHDCREMVQFDELAAAGQRAQNRRGNPLPKADRIDAALAAGKVHGLVSAYRLGVD